MVRRSLVLSLAALLCLAATQADSRVVRLTVQKRTLIAEGKGWGDAGPYERLDATAFMEVDPKDPHNSVIVNLDKAPRNSRARVEFSTPVRILKPVDMSRGNHKIWYGINNRGSCAELSFRSFPFNAASISCNPASASDISESNLLLSQGYSVVDAGWQGDGTPATERLYPDLPVARNADGSSITGLIRMELSRLDMTTIAGLPGFSGFTQPIPYDPVARFWKTYQPVDTDTSHATLTVRDTVNGPRINISPDGWAWGRCPAGRSSLQRTTTDICLFEGFSSEKIYELIYQAKDPIVMGLGYAVTRDVGAFLRYQTVDDAGNPNPLAADKIRTGIRRAYSSGTSSTGMYQRDFLYLGFNEDESRRKVFDAAMIFSAGAMRLFANVQFAHPTFFSEQDARHNFTSTPIAPFTFAVTTDPLTGVRDGILKRPKTDPLVIQIDEELTFWQWGASLNVVDGAGHPVPVPNNVRLYFTNGFGHVGAAGLLAPASPPGMCRYSQQSGTSPMSAITRAMTVVIDEWADKGIEPPKSNYPRMENGSLIRLEDYRSQFPGLPGMPPPESINTVELLDFGPQFRATGGIQSTLPPVSRKRYEQFVPRPGEDGPAAAGIDTLWTRAALGTNVGWNLRPPGIRSKDLCYLSGAYLPFAKTKAERLASSDPRRSLEERYQDHAGFVRAVDKATRELVEGRFLLPADASVLNKAAVDSDVLK